MEAIWFDNLFRKSALAQDISPNCEVPIASLFQGIRMAAGRKDHHHLPGKQSTNSLYHSDQIAISRD